jgi:hypothetical protein
MTMMIIVSKANNNNIMINTSGASERPENLFLLIDAIGGDGRTEEVFAYIVKKLGNKKNKNKRQEREATFHHLIRVGEFTF